ncbi:hypothetical protein HRbin31_00784 [bacterium HR31]|nr:hypothetical protein HRbin31_00784 [bacterium HR31]
MTSGESVLTWTAASSRASGSPSSSTQISATTRALAGVRAKVRSTAWARATNSMTAGDDATTLGSRARLRSGTRSGGTANWCSLRRWSGSRLVTRTLSLGRASTNAATSDAASSRCSKLSNTRRSWRSASTGTSSPTAPRSARRRTSRWCAMVRMTYAGWVTGARSTNTTPPGNAPATSAAASRARRVLPAPGAPVRVRRRTSSRSSRDRRWASSSSRPISRSGAEGRRTPAGGVS